MSVKKKNVVDQDSPVDVRKYRPKKKAKVLALVNVVSWKELY